MKRKVRVHGKIDLMETSAVGLPAYPYAHASAELDSYSLIKALTNASLRLGFVKEGEEIPGEKLNTEEKEAMSENQETETEKKVDENIETEKKVEEKSENISEVIAKAIKDGIKEGLDDFEAKRGMIETKPTKTRSLGEIAIDLFNRDQGLSVNK